MSKKRCGTRQLWPEWRAKTPELTVGDLSAITALQRRRRSWYRRLRAFPLMDPAHCTTQIMVNRFLTRSSRGFAVLSRHSAVSRSGCLTTTPMPYREAGR
jgi:hypothetical protein